MTDHQENPKPGDAKPEIDPLNFGSRRGGLALKLPMQPAASELPQLRREAAHFSATRPVAISTTWSACSSEHSAVAHKDATALPPGPDAIVIVLGVSPDAVVTRVDRTRTLGLICRVLSAVNRDRRRTLAELIAV